MISVAVVAAEAAFAEEEAAVDALGMLLLHEVFRFCRCETVDPFFSRGLTRDEMLLLLGLPVLVVSQ